MFGAGSGLKPRLLQSEIPPEPGPRAKTKKQNNRRPRPGQHQNPNLKPQEYMDREMQERAAEQALATCPATSTPSEAQARRPRAPAAPAAPAAPRAADCAPCARLAQIHCRTPHGAVLPRSGSHRFLATLLHGTRLHVEIGFL